MAKRQGHIMRMKSGALVPDGKLCEPDLLSKFRENEYVIIEIHKTRNIDHHRKFFALINVVFPHQEMWATQESFREALLIAAGHGEPYEAMIEVDGKKVKGVVYKAKSISFAALDQKAFEKVYDACVRVILQRILKVAPEELEKQVLEIMEGRKK